MSCYSLGLEVINVIPFPENHQCDSLGLEVINVIPFPENQLPACSIEILDHEFLEVISAIP